MPHYVQNDGRWIYVLWSYTDQPFLMELRISTDQNFDNPHTSLLYRSTIIQRNELREMGMGGWSMGGSGGFGEWREIVGRY